MQGDRSEAVERRVVSVLFADLVGFTALGERFDPEDIAAIQDRYFAAVRETASRYGGRLEKFIGDAAVAAFGVPIARDDDGERATRAGLAIVAAVDRLGAEVGLEPGELAVRVGLATGEVVHAASGPDAGRLTGDTMNTAARLQAVAPSGGVLVDEATALAVAEAVELSPAVPTELKGKAEPVRASLVLGLRPERSRDVAMGALQAATIGREAELGALAAAFERARRDHVVERWLVVAPPGTGKTRLLRELGRRLTTASPGLGVLRARFRADDPRPFGALSELFDGLEPDALAERLRAAGASEARIDVVDGLVRSLLGEAEPRSSTVDRESRFDAWLDALDAACRAAPQLWLVEDAHWAGPDALAFLEAASDRSADEGRLIVVAARPSLLEREALWSATDPEAGRHRLELRDLSGDDADGLVRALVGGALPDELVDQVAEASSGNCLFIEELLRAWASVGLLRHEADGWVLTHPPGAVAVPSTVQAVYGAQLDDLPPVARMLARRAAVAGRRFPSEALPDLGLVDATEGLATLDRRALVDGPIAGDVVGPVYVYRHALLRDAAYASLARAERARLHVALARWLEAAGGDRVAELAESIGGHYEAALGSAPALAEVVADGLDRATSARLAARWLERAARQAVAQSAWGAATDLWRRVVALTPVDDLLSLGERRLELGLTLRIGGPMDEAATALEDAMAAAREARAAGGEDAPAAREILARAGAARADLAYEQLRFQEAWDRSEALFVEIGDADDPATAWIRLSRGRARAGETNEAEPWIADADAALATARRVGDRRLELEALRELAAANGEAGRGSADDWRPVVDLATALGDWAIVVRATVNAAGYAIDVRPAEVSTMLAPVRAVAEANGLTEPLGWVGYTDCEASLASGDWPHGLETGLAALELAEERAFHRVAVRTISALLPMAGGRGDEAVVRRCLRWYEGARDRPLPASPYGRVLHAAAETWFDRFGLERHVPPDPAALAEGLATEPYGPAWLAGLAVIFRAWRDVGWLDAIEAAVAASRSALEQSPTGSALSSGALAVEAAILRQASGDRAAVIAEAARSSLDRLRPIGAAWWIARAIRVLEATGPGGATADELAEAESIETRLGLSGPAD